MLEEGYHQAFCELFNLLEQQRETHNNDNMNGSETKVVLLEDEYDKLDILKEYLIAAEASKRKGSNNCIYCFYVGFILISLYRVAILIA